MLDVTILKVYHATEKEAKKLGPYIEKCDVFSPECALENHKVITKNEDYWSLALKNASRSKIKKFIVGEGNTDDHNYALKLYDQLYCSKRLIWFLERLSDEEEKILNSIDKQFIYKLRESFWHLEKGNITMFLENMWFTRKLEEELVVSRDQNMAANLMAAEEQIRKKYPHLQQEPLRYAIQIGSVHSIEQYTSIPVTIVNMSPSNYQGIEDMVGDLFHSKTSFDQARHLLLVCGVRKIASKKKIHITDQQILAMDEPTLEKTLREMIE